MFRTFGAILHTIPLLPSCDGNSWFKSSTLLHFLGHIATTMLPRPSLLSTLMPACRPKQISIQCGALQRRFVGTEPPKLVGPMDNAFNRERLAVKHHAAQSAGELTLRL